jgi:hypothetical protein
MQMHEHNRVQQFQRKMHLLEQQQLGANLMSQADHRQALTLWSSHVAFSVLKPHDINTREEQ